MNALIPDHSPLFQHPLILFDGRCNLCDRTVNFILKRDHADIFRFVPLQSPLGIALLIRFGFSADYRESFVLIDEGQAVTKSTAFMRISRKLPLSWPLRLSFRARCAISSIPASAAIATIGLVSTIIAKSEPMISVIVLSRPFLPASQSVAIPESAKIRFYTVRTL